MREKQAARHSVQLTVNGEVHELFVESKRTLLDVLREDLDLTGTKKGCDGGQCGACTVLIEGKPVNACMVLAAEANGEQILTIEGLAEGENLHPLQESFIRNGAVQCGYCTPGMILSAKALLDGNSSPSELEIKQAISGNFCRCTGYKRIVEAIKFAAKYRP